MKGGIDWMWIWWVPTVLICAWKVLEGLLRPVKMLEWPFLACAMWGYFYGYMAYQAKMTLSAYLGNGMSEVGQLMALLCLIGLLAGWSVGKRVRVRQMSVAHAYPYGMAWFAGWCFLIVGAAGVYSVVRAQDAGVMNYNSASAYWYLLFYVGYPGLAIALWALLKMKSPTRFFLWGLTVLALIAFILPPIINARRGPLFPMIIVLLLVPPLTVRRPPSRLIYCGGLAIVGLVMILFLQVRTFTYNGGTWSDALKHLSVGTAVERGQDAEDNEYVNSTQMIGTIYQNGKYQYGTGHLGLLLHWVPRAYWRDKPELGAGSYSFQEMFDDIEQATGVRLLGSGASCAGVADTFVQYGIFCPLFWFALAYGVGAVYAKVIYGKSARWLIAYVGFICASHWLISQSFSAAFVPCMYFELVPVAVFACLWLYEQATAPPRKVRPRRAIAPNPPRALPS